VFLIYVEPSFSLLFKRGKYRSFVPLADEETDDSVREREEKRREKERYLTTAIGFCIKHDSAFQSHFLNAICDIPKTRPRPQIDVLAEPYRWGDLVLISQNRDFVCVVECKVNANLQEWQNPESQGFEKNGYGGFILSKFKTPRIIRYIVLGWKEILNLPKGRLEYAQKSWDDLAHNFPHKSRLAADLYDCFSALGVATFLLKKTQTMKIGDNAKFFGDALTLLPAAQIEAGLDEMPPKFDCGGSQVEGWWHFGVNIKRTKNVKTIRGKLQQFVTPKKGHPIGWYGYGWEREKGAYFSFWLYCASKNAQEKVKTRLIQNGVNLDYIMPETDEDSFVEVRAPFKVIQKQGLSGDRSWFSRILKATMKAT